MADPLAGALALLGEAAAPPLVDSPAAEPNLAPDTFVASLPSALPEWPLVLFAPPQQDASAPSTVTVNPPTSSEDLSAPAFGGLLDLFGAPPARRNAPPASDDDRTPRGGDGSLSPPTQNDEGGKTPPSEKGGEPGEKEPEILPTPPGPPVMVSVSTSDMYAAERGPDSGSFTFTRTGSTSGSLTVSFGVSGSATAGADYAWQGGVTPGSITFAPGQSQKTITFLPVQDSLVEGTEAVSVTVLAGSGYMVGSPPSAGAYIQDFAVQWQGQPAFVWAQNVPAAVLNDPGAMNSEEGDSVSLAMQPVSPPVGAQRYTATNLPSGLSIHPDTGVISGTIDYDAADEFDGSYLVTVLAVNGEGGSASRSFGWFVDNTPLPPDVTNPGNQENQAGDFVTLPIDCLQPDRTSATFTATNLPPGLLLDSSTGRIDGTIDRNSPVPYTYAVTVTANNEGATDSVSFEWSVAAAHHTPALMEVADQTNAVGDSIDLFMGGGDVDDDDLTYSASGLPGGLSIDPIQGNIHGVVAAGAAGGSPYSVTVSVTDPESLSASDTFIWEITPLGLAVPTDQTTREGSSVSVPLYPLGVPAGTLSYSAEGLPGGMIVDTQTGIIAGIAASGAARGLPYEVTVGVTDGTLAKFQRFTWTVQLASPSPAPTLANPGSQNSHPGESVSLLLVAGGPLATLDFRAEGLPEGLTIDRTTGEVSGTVDHLATIGEPYTVIVTAADNEGREASQTFSWVITPAPLDLEADSFQAIAHLNTGEIALATLTSADEGALFEEFTATVNWGDGQTSSAVVWGEGGEFQVLGDHTYASMGTYTVTVSVTDADDQTVTHTATALVGAPRLTLTGGYRQAAVPNQLEALTIGHVRLEGGPDAALQFSVQATMGDGSAPHSGQLLLLRDNVFAVKVSHAYAQTGTFAVQFTVSGPMTASGTSEVVVGDLYARPLGQLTVATFTASDISAQATDFTATINWGDGTSGPGWVTGSSGQFQVHGEHRYLEHSLDQPGQTYPVSVTVLGQSNTLTASDSALVLRRPAVVAVAALQPEEGVIEEDTVVAVFAAPNLADTIADYQARITWDDGEVTSGLLAGGNGLFEVRAGHEFANAPRQPRVVELMQSWPNGFLAFVAAAILQKEQGGRKRPTLSGGNPTWVLDTYGEAVAPALWTISVEDSKTGKGKSDDGGYIFQRVRVTYTLTPKLNAPPPNRVEFPHVTVGQGNNRRPAVFTDVFPDFLHSRGVFKFTDHVYSTDYWEVWRLPSGEDRPSNNALSKLPKAAADAFEVKYPKLKIEKFHDVFWTPQLKGIHAGKIEMEGKVYFIEGLEDIPAAFRDYPLDGLSSPAGSLLSFSHIDPATGKETEAGKAMEAFIKSYPAERSSFGQQHVLRVEWHGANLKGKTRFTSQTPGVSLKVPKHSDVPPKE